MYMYVHVLGVLVNECMLLLHSCLFIIFVSMESDC